MSQRAAVGLDVQPSTVTSALVSDTLEETVVAFLEGGPEAPRRLFVYTLEAEPDSSSARDGEEEDWVSGTDSPRSSADPPVCVSADDRIDLQGRCVYFVRISSEGVSTDTVEASLMVGELVAPLLDSLQLSVGELWTPALHALPQAEWGMASDDSVQDFLAVLDRFKVRNKIFILII